MLRLWRYAVWMWRHRLVQWKMWLRGWLEWEKRCLMWVRTGRRELMLYEFTTFILSVVSQSVSRVLSPANSYSHYHQACTKHSHAGVVFTQWSKNGFFVVQVWHITAINVKFGIWTLQFDLWPAGKNITFFVYSRSATHDPHHTGMVTGRSMPFLHPQTFFYLISNFAARGYWKFVGKRAHHRKCL